MPVKPPANRRLGHAMLDAGLTVAALAARAGVSRRTIASILHCPDHRPHPATMQRITAALATPTKAPTP